MKKNIFLLLCLISLCAIVACSDKKQSQTIITHKPKKEQARPVQKIGDYKDSTFVTWNNEVYKVVIIRKADNQLPIVKDDNGIKFYDNSITVKIAKRANGQVIFEHVFTKSDFAKYLDESFKQENVLQGVVFDEIEDNNLLLVGSVGAGDKSNDEFVPFKIKISKGGTMTIEKSSKMEDADEDTM